MKDFNIDMIRELTLEESIFKSFVYNLIQHIYAIVRKNLFHSKSPSIYTFLLRYLVESLQLPKKQFQ